MILLKDLAFVNFQNKKKEVPKTNFIRWLSKMRTNTLVQNSMAVLLVLVRALAETKTLRIRAASTVIH